MLRAEFQVKIQNGQIQIPESLQQEFEGIEGVKVILIKPTASGWKQSRQRDIIDELTQNPVKVDGFLTREEAHDRKL